MNIIAKSLYATYTKLAKYLRSDNYGQFHTIILLGIQI